MIEICNLKSTCIEYAFDYRADRRSVLGNKFRMYNELDRDKVCDLYEQWFNEQVASGNEVVLNELRYLYKLHQKYGRLRLFCWCAPKRCHCETIRSFLNKYIEKGVK